MKTVHLISGGDSGGAQTHVLSLLRELNTGGPVPLLCLGGGPLAEKAAAMDLPCTVLSGGFPAQLRRAGELLSASGAELLHCHGSRANLTGALLKGRPGLRVISTVHSDYRLDYLGRPLARMTYGTLNAWALRRMDALVCVSDAMAEVCRARGFSPVYPIYNGIDFSAPPRPRREDDGTVVVAAAARLDPVKDLPTLLRGFALAAAREPRLRLALAGAGPEEARLRALAAALGVDDRVTFAGWVEDLDAFYAAADIAALTSRWETFPYALTLAARQGLPAVATAVGGIPDLVEDGVSGVLTAVGDAAALAEAFAMLAADPAARAAMGAALRARAETRFSLTAMGRRQREIYEEILRNRGTEE